MPVSRTPTMTQSGCRVASMAILPPSLVYWTAFVQRFWITCPRRFGSPFMGGRAGGIVTENLSCLRCATTSTRDFTSVMT